VNDLHHADHDQPDAGHDRERDERAERDTMSTMRAMKVTTPKSACQPLAGRASVDSATTVVGRDLTP